MNIHILISALALTPLFAMAQSTEPDSIKTQELDEVVVEARNQRLGAEVSTYIPTSKQRNASQNAIDLLRQMAIPQIQINPIDNSIKDNGGGEVSIFFNNMPASQEDIEGLRTADVRRVEYLEFPTDPRFRGRNTLSISSFRNMNMVATRKLQPMKIFSSVYHRGQTSLQSLLIRR